MCLFVLARRIYCVCTYLQPYLLDMLYEWRWECDVYHETRRSNSIQKQKT
jgi:hypothetical protein